MCEIFFEPYICSSRMCPVGPLCYRRAVLKCIRISILCLRGLGEGSDEDIYVWGNLVMTIYLRLGYLNILIDFLISFCSNYAYGVLDS